MNLNLRLRLAFFMMIVVLIGFPAAARCAPANAKAPGRIIVLMVWDGLRPDFVTKADTPNLFAMEHDGVRFAHQHAVYPTITMVNAAAIATGGNPGATGIYGDKMYMPAVHDNEPVKSANGKLERQVVDLEDSHLLAPLNGPAIFNGGLVGVEAIAQQVVSAGGYAAIIGKAGPTFLFDDSVASNKNDKDKSESSHLLFIADDMSEPADALKGVANKPRINFGHLKTISQRDAWFARIVVDKALPAAKLAAENHQLALVIFWQHDPDLVQHVAGLGTAPSIAALHACDANLGMIRAAIAKDGIAGNTDLIVMSDHGFATIKAMVPVAKLLVGAGIKKSITGKGVVIVEDGGSDLVYLSRTDYPTEAKRHAVLQKIVDLAESQEWSGPIFSRTPAGHPESHLRYRGWIPGTFNETAFGLYNRERSPDLIISFRELPDVSNRDLTGPKNPGWTYESGGLKKGPNHSFPLIHPVEGVIYADEGRFTTGMGMHGTAGRRELHNYCAAIGPDFRSHYVDEDPTGNADIAPTIRSLFHLPEPPGSSARVMQEALSSAPPVTAKPEKVLIPTKLVLDGTKIVTTLRFSRLEGHDYLDGSTVTHTHVTKAAPTLH